jgi:type I site-specific restriction endonuclease
MQDSVLRCLIRKKEVPCTPEEEVRQRILRYMIENLAYPAGLIAVEITVKFNSMDKRADIVVYDRKGEPWMIVECKRPTERLNQKTIAQVAMYNNSLQVPFLMLSNGHDNHILKIDREENSIVRLQSMPTYP